MPHRESSIKPEIVREGNLNITKFAATRFFTVEKWIVRGNADKKLEEFTLVSVLSGKGKVNDLEISKGDHFILTSVCKEAHFKGELEMITSWIDRTQIV